MINEKIVDDMKKLGFSTYEVKAYMGLLEKYPVNGYVLSKQSGIPRSRVYEVLQSLEEKQVVFEQQDGDATVYYPLEPKLLVKKLQVEVDSIIEHVDRYTAERFNRTKEDQRMIVMKDRAKILDFIKLLISEAKNRIALSIWEEEVGYMMDVLKEAKARGVNIRGIYFGDALPFETMVAHRRVNRYLLEKKERHISVIIDGEQVVSGVMSRGLDSRVTWIKDIGFVQMSEDYISHDVMINKYSETLDGNDKKEFEHYSDVARKEYFDYTDDEFEQFLKE